MNHTDRLSLAGTRGARKLSFYLKNFPNLSWIFSVFKLFYRYICELSPGIILSKTYNTICDFYSIRLSCFFLCDISRKITFDIDYELLIPARVVAINYAYYQLI